MYKNTNDNHNKMIHILMQHIETQYKMITIIFNYNNSNHHFNDLKINNLWYFCQTFSLINGTLN